MSNRPPAQSRPGFVKVCLCPEITFTKSGKPKRRDLTAQCKVCLGFAAIERCSDCEDRGAIKVEGRPNRRAGRRSVWTCETCQGRGYKRTDRKYDAYAERPKEKKPKKKRKK